MKFVTIEVPQAKSISDYLEAYTLTLENNSYMKKKEVPKINAFIIMLRERAENAEDV